MIRSTLMCALAIAFTATVASAGVVETGSDRYDYALAAGAGTSDGPYQNNGTPIYGNFTDTTSATASDSGGSGDARGQQTSSIDPGLYVADLEAFAAASAEPFESGSARADAYYEVSFTVTSPVDYMLTGDGSVNGGDSVLQIRLVNVGSGGSPTETFVNFIGGNSSTTLNESGTLLPGDYELRAHAWTDISYFFEFGAESNSSTSAANFTMTLTPEPSSIVLLAIGGLAAVRRRRTAGA